MKFSTELQGQTSHESLIKLQDTEIRLLETIKKSVTQRVKCDRDYAQSLTQLLAVSNKFDNPDKFVSPVFRAWSTVVSETENIAKQIRSNADHMCNSTIEKLVDLLAEKKATRKLYIDERNRIEQELNKIKDQVQKLKGEYEKNLTKCTQDKAKYEDATSKGKVGKKLEDVKSKYIKSTGHLHKIHNDYIATLENVTIHQQDYLTSILPGLLGYQQEVQESMIQQCKDVLQEYTSKTDFSSEEFSKCHSEISKAIGAVNPSGEHDEFLNEYRTDPLENNAYNFDSNILADVNVNLAPNVLAIDDLTVSSLEQTVANFEVEMNGLKDRKEKKEKELQTCEEELNKLPPLNTMEDSDKKSYYLHKKTAQQLRKDILELECHETKFKSLYNFVHDPLSNLKGDAPVGCVLSDGSPVVLERTDSSRKAPNITQAEPDHSSSSLTSIEEKAQVAKDKFHSVKKSLADKFKKQKGQNPPEPPTKDFLGSGNNSSSSKPQEILQDASKNTSAASIAQELKARNRNEDKQEGSPLPSPPPTKEPPQPPKKPPKYEQCEVSAVNPGIRNSEIVSRPIQEEEWFHGVLPRDEVVRLLQEDGDYLVRESKHRKTGEVQYVLSVMFSDHKHFIIQSSGNQWRFEGNYFNSIQELIRDQHSSGSPVTKKSQAILKRAILRESWELSNDDINLGIKLGNGNFGDVFKGVFKGDDVAVKTCKETLSEDQKKKFLQEGRILKQYNHPNIVRFVGIAAQRQPVMIVMEYVAGGALLSYLRTEGKKQKKLTAKQLIKMCLDASAGMAYLEEKSCIHRDLAARNCLVGKDNVVKISDFGMSREEEEYTVSGGLKQIPIKWTAPEALNFGTYTTACDVWSYGILIWEIFSFGSTPYPGLTNNQARERVDEGYRMPAPEATPAAVHELMMKCWEAEPKDRCKFSDIHSELGKILKINS